MIDMPWRKKRSSKKYLDSDELLDEVKKSIADGRKATERLGQMCQLIVQHIIWSRRFSGYPSYWKDEMASYALLRCMKAMKTVDPSKCKNIFNYYTRIVWTSFMLELGRLKKTREVPMEKLTMP